MRRFGGPNRFGTGTGSGSGGSGSLRETRTEPVYRAGPVRSAGDVVGALQVAASALDYGGVLLAVPSGRHVELRVTVAIGDGGRRRFHVREWFRAADATWRAGRRGMNGLSGADLRRLAAVLEVAGAVAPSRRAARRRAT